MFSLRLKYKRAFDRCNNCFYLFSDKFEINNELSLADNLHETTNSKGVHLVGK